MWSGRKTFGKRTVVGRGNNGSKSAMADCRLVYGLRLLVHVVHEHVLPERVRRREIRLALADVRHAAHEADEVVVARQHERVDENPALAARGDLGARFRDDERVEAERVLEDP